MEEELNQGMEGASRPNFCLQLLHYLFVDGSLVLDERRRTSELLPTQGVPTVPYRGRSVTVQGGKGRWVKGVPEGQPITMGQ